VRCPFAAAGLAFTACGSACANLADRGLSLPAATVAALALRIDPAAAVFRLPPALVSACAVRLRSRDFIVRMM
jgi:hypothetical protein